MSGELEVDGPLAPGKTSWSEDKLLSAMADVEARADRQYALLARRVERLERAKGIRFAGMEDHEDLLTSIVVGLVVFGIATRVLGLVFGVRE